jgi:hypothetical protein
MVEVRELNLVFARCYGGVEAARPVTLVWDFFSGMLPEVSSLACDSWQDISQENTKDKRIYKINGCFVHCLATGCIAHASLASPPPSIDWPV